MTIQLRPYQLRANAEIREAMRAGHRRVLLVAPTAFGKTATASEIMRSAVAKGRRVLFLVHRREIVNDTARRLRAAGVPCGVLMAGVRTAGDPPVTVASIQTVVARETFPRADLVIWDEAHHAAAAQYVAVAAIYPAAHHLGLTATPERGDGVGLRDAFDAIILGATVRELQAEGYLAECDVLAPGTRIRGGLACEPAEAWRMYAEGRPTVAFCRSVDESIALAEALGPRARHVDGTTPLATRAAILDDFAAGRIDVLTNVFVLTEGWDCSRAKVCLLARGIGHSGAYLQMVGRVLRRHGEERALVIDLGGVLHDHGMPDEDRTYSLDGITRAVPEKREWISRCLACGTEVRGATRGEHCAVCKAPWPEREPVVITGAPLAKIAKVSRDEKVREFARLQEIARLRGYKQGWVSHQYRARFGVWPVGVREKADH